MMKSEGADEEPNFDEQQSRRRVTARPRSEARREIAALLRGSGRAL